MRSASSRTRRSSSRRRWSRCCRTIHPSSCGSRTTNRHGSPRTSTSEMSTRCARTTRSTRISRRPYSAWTDPNHPSIVMLIAHDEPPWLATNFDLGDVHAVRQNHSIDQDLKASFERLDPTRPAIAASGDIDLHLTLGWSGGSWKDIAHLEPLMVSAFGAQALPSADSPAWDEIGRRWPVADDEPAWRYAGVQPVNWAERGAGLPSAHQSLESMID